MTSLTIKLKSTTCISKVYLLEAKACLIPWPAVVMEPTRLGWQCLVSPRQQLRTSWSSFLNVAPSFNITSPSTVTGWTFGIRQGTRPSQPSADQAGFSAAHSWLGWSSLQTPKLRPSPMVAKVSLTKPVRAPGLLGWTRQWRLWTIPASMEARPTDRFDRWHKLTRPRIVNMRWDVSLTDWKQK